MIMSETHRSTNGKWFKNYNIDPGFTVQSFEVLKNYTEINKNILISLIFDEMSIRKNLELDGKKFHDYINYGIDADDDQNAMAKEVFVPTTVCLNGKWKLPLGYFFVNGLRGDQKCTIVSHCVKETQGHM